jgi:hypothetical protein
MAHLTRLSRSQRASIAALLTLAGVVGMEVAHFSSGDTLVLEVSYFAIPAILALLLFDKVKERAIAFVLLTGVGLVGVGLAIYVYLKW